MPLSFASDSDIIPDLSNYFYFSQSNSAVMSGNVITVADTHNTLVFNDDIKHSFEFDFTFNFNSGGTSETSFPLMTWLYNTSGEWSNLVNCVGQGGYLKVNGSGFIAGSGHYKSNGTTASFLRVFSNGGATSTYTITNLIIDGESVGESPTFSAPRTITIQPGYVAYIETDGGTLDITAQFPNYSRLWRPLWDSAVQIAFGVFYPSAGFTFTDNYGSTIDWLIPASAPTNLLGQSKIGARSYTAGLPDNGSNVAIYNPAYSGVSSNSNSYGRALKAPTLTVTISNCVWVRWYELRTSATISPASGSAISAGSDDNYTSSVNYYPTEEESDSVVTDADTFYFNSTNNTTSAGVTMNSGGSNYGTDDTVEDANNLLNNLEEKITSLLSAPINHITNLINNATAFFAEIIHFFDWLPPEVRSVIVSCLALIPVIGFIKLLF